MPWTAKQVAFFHAVASGRAKKKGMTKKHARSLLREDPRGTRPAVEVAKR